jgi:hypothetical protein
MTFKFELILAFQIKANKIKSNIVYFHNPKHNSNDKVSMAIREMRTIHKGIKKNTGRHQRILFGDQRTERVY